MAPRERTSSRIIKKERSKLWKQTVTYVAIALILGIAFVVIVLPNFLRLVDSFLDTNPLPTEEEEQIVQAPTLSAPVAATNSAELIVQGFAQPNQEVTFVVNGEQSPGSTTDDAGSFLSTVFLTEGENVVTAFVTTERGTESPVGRQYTVTLDTEAPELEVTEPEEGQSFDAKEQTITVAGTTDAQAKVYLNDRFVSVRSDGSFSTRFSPEKGDNTLIIKSVDPGGNTTEIERTIRYAE